MGNKIYVLIGEVCTNWLNILFQIGDDFPHAIVFLKENIKINLPGFICLYYYININCYFHLINQSTICTGEEKPHKVFLSSKASMLVFNNSLCSKQSRREKVTSTHLIFLVISSLIAPLKLYTNSWKGLFNISCHEVQNSWYSMTICLYYRASCQLPVNTTIKILNIQKAHKLLKKNYAIVCNLAHDSSIEFKG